MYAKLQRHKQQQGKSIQQRTTCGQWVHFIRSIVPVLQSITITTQLLFHFTKMTSIGTTILHRQSTPPLDEEMDLLQTSDDNDNNDWTNDTNGHMSTNHFGTRRRAFVDWIQQQRLPKVLQPQKMQHEDIHLVQGLDRVLYGTLAAADAVTILGWKPPRYLWYMLSGFACDLIQFQVDLLLHYGLGLQDASVCWFLGFSISVLFRHTSHRYLVFGKRQSLHLTYVC
jgi:hypothetical protein